MNENKTLLEKMFELQHTYLEIKKDKEAYGYMYAPLDAIHKALLPKLKELGIGFYHRTGYDQGSKQNQLTTVVYNIDNIDDILISTTNIDDSIKLSGMNKFMVIGSAMTYFRRYHLVSMFGLLADEDTDAGGARKNTNTKSRKARPNVVNTPAETNYVTIFENLISKGKPKLQIQKQLDNYKAQIPEAQFKEIDDLIKKMK